MSEAPLPFSTSRPRAPSTPAPSRIPSSSGWAPATTGCSTRESRRSRKTIERVGYATSSDGIAWTKRGVVLGPSLMPYAYDEVGVEPAGMLVDGSTLMSGRVVSTEPGGRAADMPPPPIRRPDGAAWAPERLGDVSARRHVDDEPRLPADRPHLDGELGRAWLSFLQPYSSTGNELWSDYFPVTVSNASETLNFLLTVHAVRWQARLSGPAGNCARQGRVAARTGQLLAHRHRGFRVHRSVAGTRRHRLAVLHRHDEPLLARRRRSGTATARLVNAARGAGCDRPVATGETTST